jgi:anti-anti-sigma factor
MTFEVNDELRVVVVTILMPDLEEDWAVASLRLGFDQYLFAEPPASHVVVDLGNVVSISGRAIAFLATAGIRLARAGGSLRLCQARPGVSRIIEQARLPALVKTFSTVDDAVVAHRR